jgi:hypothetical protein
MAGDDGYLYPESYAALANSSLNRSWWLGQCAHAAKYESIHGAANMPEPQRSQRNAILEIASKLFDAASKREAAQAIQEWKGFFNASQR